MVKSYQYDNASDIKRVSSYVNILARQLTKDYPEYRIDEWYTTLTEYYEAYKAFFDENASLSVTLPSLSLPAASCESSIFAAPTLTAWLGRACSVFTSV